MLRGVFLSVCHNENVFEGTLVRILALLAVVLKNSKVKERQQKFRFSPDQAARQVIALVVRTPGLFFAKRMVNIALGLFKKVLRWGLLLGHKVPNESLHFEGRLMASIRQDLRHEPLLVSLPKPEVNDNSTRMPRQQGVLSSKGIPDIVL